MTDKQQIGVSIDLDQTWAFFPSVYSNPTMMIDLEFYEEFKQVSTRYFELMQKMEMLYNIQRGKQVFGDTSLIPDYTLIPKS